MDTVVEEDSEGDTDMDMETDTRQEHCNIIRRLHPLLTFMSWKVAIILK
jgi:hypothetical protein